MQYPTTYLAVVFKNYFMLNVWFGLLRVVRDNTSPTARVISRKPLP